jgi:hypothetical protein
MKASSNGLAAKNTQILLRIQAHVKLMRLRNPAAILEARSDAIVSDRATLKFSARFPSPNASHQRGRA